MTDGQTDGQTDGRTDGGDCNIPDAFLKKRGDNYAVLYMFKNVLRAYSSPKCFLFVRFTVIFLIKLNYVVDVLIVGLHLQSLCGCFANVRRMSDSFLVFFI